MAEVRPARRLPWQWVSLLITVGLLALVGLGNAPWWNSWLRDATVPPAQARYPYNDFAEEIAAARLILSPQRAQLYNIDVQLAGQAAIWAPRWPPVGSPPLPFPRLPWAALALVPLLALPHALAFLVFTAISFLAAGIALALLTRWARLPPLVGGAFVLAGWGSFPMLRIVVLGQWSAFALLAVTAALILLWNGRARGAGLALVAATLKPHLIVLVGLAWLLTGQRRALAGAAAGLLALVALSVGILGPQWLADYPRLVRDLSPFDAVDQMQNWRGLLENTLGLREPLLSPLLWGSMGAMAGVVVWTWWPRRGSLLGGWGLGTAAPASGQARLSAPDDLRWALTVLASLVFSTHLHYNDLLLWAIPAAIGLRRVYAPPPGGALGPEARAGVLALCWVGLFVPAVAFFVPAARPGLWFALGVMALLAARIRQEDRRLRGEG